MSQQNYPKVTKMIPNGYLIFEDESFLDSTVAKMNALRKSGQFCDVRLQVGAIKRTSASVQPFKLQAFASYSSPLRFCSEVELFRANRPVSAQPLGHKEPYAFNG